MELPILSVVHAFFAYPVHNQHVNLSPDMMKYFQNRGALMMHSHGTALPSSRQGRRLMSKILSESASSRKMIATSPEDDLLERQLSMSWSRSTCYVCSVWAGQLVLDNCVWGGGAVS